MTAPLDPTWRQALLDSGAHFDGDTPRDFGDAAAELRDCAGATVVCDLARFALVHVTGPDATDFLHGQFTADLRGLPPDRSTLAGYCTPKGRLLAIVRAWRDPRDGLWLAMPRDIAPATVARLRMFVLRSRVRLSEPDEGMATFGLIGPDAPGRVRKLAGAWSEDPGGVVRIGEVAALHVPSDPPRAWLAGPVADVAALWRTWQSGCRPVPGRCWDALDLAACLPWVWAGTREQFLPQSLNLDALGAVSFSKGCYPGQEIVARTRYLGRVKQRMFAAGGPQTAPPAPGDKVYCAALGDQPAGYVVEAMGAGPDGWAGLVTAPRAGAATRPLRLGGPEGPAVRVSDPPYPLPPDADDASEPPTI